ncbi:hypothetical protein TRVL_04348 [Trypanosoma vivax]|nr:hypothetical protein TRVL_04348 [Trypanosoma vivax]
MRTCQEASSPCLSCVAGELGWHSCCAALQVKTRSTLSDPPFLRMRVSNARGFLQNSPPPHRSHVISQRPLAWFCRAATRRFFPSGCHGTGLAFHAVQYSKGRCSRLSALPASPRPTATQRLASFCSPFCRASVPCVCPRPFLYFIFASVDAPLRCHMRVVSRVCARRRAPAPPGRSFARCASIPPSRPAVDQHTLLQRPRRPVV